MTVKPVYLVLGMHRSGTSAVTQLLALAGCGLPRDVLPADEHNARGYFEPWRVSVFNDERLRAGASAWDDPLGFPFRPLADDDAWGSRAAALVAQQFDLAAAPLLKDPRVSLLMPLWRSVFASAGLSPLCVVPVRDPLAVAASLAKRNGFSVQKSILLWCSYMLAAEAYSRGLPRVFVAYDALLTDWRLQARRIESALGAPLPNLDDPAARGIDAFLSADLRHNAAGTRLSDHGWAGDVAAPLLAWFEAAACDAAPGDDAIKGASVALEALRAQVGELISPIASDLDQARADLLFAHQLVAWERTRFQEQLDRMTAAYEAVKASLS